MRVRGFAILLLIMLIAIIMTATTRSQPEVQSRKDQGIPNTTTPTVNSTSRTNPPGTIDGSKNPELISDNVAYSVLFRFLSNHLTESGKNEMRFYLKLKLGGSCYDTKEMQQSTDTITDVLLTAAEQFNKGITPLDVRVKSIKDKHWPNRTAGAMTELAHMQSQKESLVTQTVAFIRTRLNHEDMQRVQQLIHEHFKRKIKIAPRVQSPPGGPGWHEMKTHHSDS